MNDLDWLQFLTPYCINIDCGTIAAHLAVCPQLIILAYVCSLSTNVMYGSLYF